MLGLCIRIKVRDAVGSQGSLEQGTWGFCVLWASIALYRNYCVDGSSVERHRELDLLWVGNLNSKVHPLVLGSRWKFHPFAA